MKIMINTYIGGISLDGPTLDTKRPSAVQLNYLHFLLRIFAHIR